MISKVATAACLIGTLILGSAPASTTMQNGSAYEFTLTAIDGTPLPLEQFRGKALLLVNTASLCGFTRQYEGLQEIWEAYRERGLVVVAIPSNDFGGQEPKSEIEIEDFCRGAFGVTFPLAEKTRVRGPDAHAFYQWAAVTLGAAAMPRWNFHKYLIDANGYLVASFPATVTPRSRRLKSAIEAALPALER